MHNNHIFLTWTQFDQYGSFNPADSSIILFSRSFDQGETWSEAKRINQHAGGASTATIPWKVPPQQWGLTANCMWCGPARRTDLRSFIR